MEPYKRHGFKHGDEESNYTQLLERSGLVERKRQYAPCESTERDPVPRTNLQQDQVMGNQSDNISNIETGVHQVELVTLHVKIFLHTRYIGVNQVGSV